MPRIWIASSRLWKNSTEIYGKYPEYPVTDAGYGSFNNYLYCEEHGMGKYMKFTMYEKESKNIKYHNDPYRAVNFRIDETVICCVLTTKNSITFTAGP